MWPWSEIKRLRQELDDAIVQRATDAERLRAQRDMSNKLAMDLANVVEEQVRQITELRATISTFRKTGVIVNLTQEKKPP